jgi:hypothetical protein
LGHDVVITWEIREVRLIALSRSSMPVCGCRLWWILLLPYLFGILVVFEN